MTARTLLRGADVVTMAAGRPDTERIDLLIEDDTIAAVGPDVDTADADVVDLPGRVIIPGLINAHLHTWQTALRGIGADWTMLEYLPRMHGELAPRYEPDDIYVGTLFGALSQINSGTTTIGDWAHNNRTPEHADASIAALHQSGVRAAFLYGPEGYKPDVAHPVAEIDRLLDTAANPLITIGMAIGGPQISTPDIAVADLREAAERGVVASMHHSGGQAAPAWTAAHNEGLFHDRTNIVHGTGLSEQWIKTLVDAGATFTTTPENELGHGHGTPITAILLAHGTAPSLGSDTETATLGGLLGIARLAMAHQRGLDHDAARRETGMMSPTATVTAKQALSWATVEGARALGLADRVGCIEAGLQADLVVIDARQFNLWPTSDPITAALYSDLANVEAVMIAGTWRKKDHQLLGVEIDSIKERLGQSRERLLQRSPV
jgi:5-methylthioadenosine/S-adenosylhomocysteine deaminase